MNELLRFFREYEIWIYFFLILGGLVYARRLILGIQERRATIFGLERETAQAKLNQAATVLVLLILIGIGEFSIVTYVAPLVPESNPLLTPTIDVLATPTVTLAPEDPFSAMASEEGTPGPTPTVDARIGTCVPGELEITSPQPGEQLREEVVIEGSASIENFGFYKLEVTVQDQVNWRTIQAAREPVENGVLIDLWDTTTLAPGNYLLRLVVTDNNGNASPDCGVPITILAPEN